jgi:hypothetical protein
MTAMAEASVFIIAAYEKSWQTHKRGKGPGL